MAEDAFALSPMSARASLPSEADYDAIRDAFMETARGRWFLTEYAKRNRNADTSMVLDAVARIEASVAARGEASLSPAAVIAMIRPLIAEARAISDAVMNAPETEDTVAAARKATRIIREISWSLRETGTDPRICKILDTQLLAFETINDLASDGTPRALIGEAFDDLILKLEEIGSGVRMAQRETPEPMPEPVETIGANLDAADMAPTRETSVAPAYAAPDRPAETDGHIAQVDETEVRDTAPTADEMAADAAVLDLIAMEMSVPEIDDGDDFDGDDALAELQSLAETAPQPAPTMPAPAMPSPTMPDTITVTPAATAPDSLGASLLASGVVRMPRVASEALAAFRRMSQTEKIAFFS